MAVLGRSRQSSLRRRVAGFDTAVDEAFDHLRGRPALDRLFYGASALGDHGLIWLILGAVRGLRSERDWHAAVRVGLGVGVESALVNLGIKSLFRRRRPAVELPRPLRLRRPRTSSFPSGHATSAFTAAGLLSDGDRAWPLYYAVAVVVASSRVYVRIHHASDVVAGIAVGVALGRIGRRLFPLPAAPGVADLPSAPESVPPPGR
ncbi:MAG TPA: phosphatase PAP2 family protein [Acidimicrobiales bacterium]|nr:phosphatase PAP2 family protein [Acidimicrobiales bacterium]